MMEIVFFIINMLLANGQTPVVIDGVNVYRWGGNNVAIGNSVYLRYDANDDILRHEIGHAKQYQQLGADWYYALIAIPSIIGNLLTIVWRIMVRGQGDMTSIYYALPWEAWANELGGVNVQ